MSEKTGIQRALEMFDGSPSKLATAVGNGVLRQHVEHWLGAGRVSAEKTPDVAAVTGIPEEDLNDRVNWAKVRQNKALESTAPAANHAGAIRTVAEEAKGAIRDFEQEAEAALEDVAENVKGGLKQLIRQAETTLAKGAGPAAQPPAQAGPGPLPIVDFEDSLPPISFPDSLPAADAPGSGDTNHQTGA